MCFVAWPTAALDAIGVRLIGTLAALLRFAQAVFGLELLIWLVRHDRSLFKPQDGFVA